MWNFVHAEELSFKKTVLVSEQDRPDVARRREQWTARQKRVEPVRLVFIDETWTKTNMAPLRGWARRGAAAGQGAAASLEDNDLPRRAAARPHRCPVACRRSDQRRALPLYVEKVLVPSLFHAPAVEDRVDLNGDPLDVGGQQVAAWLW